MFPFRRNKLRSQSDEELILAFRNEGSSSAFGILYERYGHLVLGTCMKYLKSEAEAEDMTMQIFEDLHLKLVKYDIQHFKSWLYRLTKNECLMWLRKNKRMNHTDETQLISEETEIPNIEEKELKILLMEETLNELKEEQKICLDLFYIKDLSYQQISDQLNIDLKQVKSSIQNGKRNLKLKLEEHHEFRSQK